MMVVDTSALMAILLDEPEAKACVSALEREDEPVISAGTMSEALVVGASRGVADGVERLIDRLGFEIAPVTAASARRVALAYARWGKGAHPARLNFGDCFAYQEAKERGCSLLYVGSDFSQTDIDSAI